MRATSTTHGRLRGHVRISTLDGSLLLEGDNQVTDYGNEEFIRSLIARDLDALAGDIAIGEGGDCDIVDHLDTGARVGPVATETEIRVLVQAITITSVSREVDGSITFKALARREQANSPNINEFALLTRDAQMIAHFVTEEVAPLGRATKYPKTELMFVICEWNIQFTGV